MKKIFLSLIAAVACMSINAQVVKVYEDGALKETYTNGTHKYKVVFEEAPAITTHDYVEIGGVKWATMNVGATTVAGNPATCYGDYYAWSETKPRYTSITISGENSVSFGGWHSSFSNGYTTNATYSGNTLDADHDAATQNWGSDWCTPTQENFKALLNACTGSTESVQPSELTTSNPGGGVYWLSSTQTYLSEYTGVKGTLFVDKTDTKKQLFFPAAGNFYGTGFNGGGSAGKYWFNAASSDWAIYKLCVVTFENGQEFTACESCCGIPVRAVRVQK